MTILKSQSQFQNDNFKITITMLKWQFQNHNHNVKITISVSLGGGLDKAGRILRSGSRSIYWLDSWELDAAGYNHNPI